MEVEPEQTDAQANPTPLHRSSTRSEVQKDSKGIKRGKDGYQRFSVSVSPVRRGPGRRGSLTSVISLSKPLLNGEEDEPEEVQKAVTKAPVSTATSRLSKRSPRNRISVLDLKQKLKMVESIYATPNNKKQGKKDCNLVSVGVLLQVPSVMVPFAKAIPKEILKAQRKKLNAQNDLDNTLSDFQFDTGFADLTESEHFAFPTFPSMV